MKFVLLDFKSSLILVVKSQLNMRCYADLACILVHGSLVFSLNIWGKAIFVRPFLKAQILFHDFFHTSVFSR